MSSRDTSELGHRLRAGDPAAQRALFEGHYESLRAYLVRSEVRNRSEADADEIASETFRRAFRSVGSIPNGGASRTWLLLLARRAAIDYYRVRRHRTIPSAASNSSALSSLVSELGPPVTQAIRRESRGRLLDHIERLDPDYRRVVSLRLGERLTTRETAKVMERGESAVKMLLLRAMRQLRELVEADPYFASESK